jgi:uroporphyrinogen decarboxylase
MPMTTKRQRLSGAIAGEPVDRPPVALWRHFPVDDQDPETLAEATIAFQEDFDFDFVKVSPASSFCLRDWGAEDVWRGDPEGTRDYTRRPIEDPEDWLTLRPLDAGGGNLGKQLACLSILQRKFADDVPYVQTIFSPLSQAKNLAGGERLLEHLRREPKSVEAGLRTIAETTAGFIHEARKTGIAGIFFAVQHASYSLLDREAFRRFGEAYDLPVLEAAQGLWLNVLHLHGKSLMFDVASIYPTAVVNWHDRETPPALELGKRAFHGAACGGLSIWETVVVGTPASVRAEARESIHSVKGRGLILGTGCVVPIVAPRANLQAARAAVEVD